MKKRRILILSSASLSLINFRGDFIRHLLSHGFEVVAAAPNFHPDVVIELKTIGVDSAEYQLQRTGLNPYKDLKTYFELKKLIRDHQIDLVFPYTIKPVIYGSLAANACGISTVSLITGLGFTFSGASQKAKILQRVTAYLYKKALGKNKMVIFQNEDDPKLFLDEGIIDAQQPYTVVNGSGVNLERYPFREKKNTGGRIIFLLVARLIKEKGVQLYIQAASMLKPDFPEAEFHIIGSPATSPSAISLEELHTLHEAGTIVYHGRQKKVSDFLTGSDVFVLPTYYREGVPRSILEALSVGLPIITTNSPGCRETVQAGRNGLLIAPRDQEQLNNALEYFIGNRSEIHKMGLESRRLAEEKFDVHIINDFLLQQIQSVLEPESTVSGHIG